jgi:LmbE family N-acetylglucosaminyl deacetylase
MNRRLVLLATLAATAVTVAGQQRTPQYRIESLNDLSGAPGLSLALRKLGTVGTLMHATAHPDDENNAMLALYARHLGMRVALVSATRGDGGQNEIGPELFDALGILRTEELLAAHQYDGAEQYFTRAVDFGYSFSPEETLEKWGREEILGDLVRLIRTIRPDVIVTLGTEGRGGGQHHQTSAVIAGEAYKAAADPAQFPEQIKEGLRPWQVKKLYRPAGGPGGFGRGGGRGGPGGRGGRGDQPGQPPAPPAAPPDPNAKFATLDLNRYEPLLGCTIGEIGSVASGMHICQGRAPLVSPPSAPSARYRLAETVVASARDRDETSLFDGIDTSLNGLARFAGVRQPDALVRGLANIAAHVTGANQALRVEGQAAVVPWLVEGLAIVRDLRAQLPKIVESEDGRYEIDLRLRLKEEQFQDALILAQSVRIDVTANDGLVVAGQPISVTVGMANRGDTDVAVRSIQLVGLEGQSGCAPGSIAPRMPFSCVAQARIPADAALTGPYWDRPEDAGRAVFARDAPFGLPFRPTPFKARLELDVAGARVVLERPVQLRYDGNAGLAGEKRMELNVVPAFAVSVSPKIAVLPLKPQPGGNQSRGRELRVTVVNGTKGAATASVRLKAPAGWTMTPAASTLTFTREDEAMTTRFVVTPPSQVGAGDVDVTAEVFGAQSTGAPASATFATGYQVIEYPHIQRRHKLIPAVAKMKVLDVAVAPSLSVGYVMGVGDQVPPALLQLGAHVTLIDGDELAWGDLSKYHTIVTGVRAYERRDDLRANNHRLIDYVANGGTVIVQYNKMEFNQAQYGPLDALVSSNRITDEHAPVKVLVPAHPAFTWPNQIDASAWNGWVQERGLYFLGDKNAKYVDLVEMEDPFEFNRGAKRGALVEARHGKGRWLYVGLGLWRQLPAGTNGAYKLMANLVSLGKARAE